ncbi:hypothetical protein Xvtw_13295 [Xanthomonas campestris pv. vitiswoodrowii]|nr:hypothetical protein Xvtw_13295 [Xanthomonas campestris pv. vitiswoodrowii]
MCGAITNNLIQFDENFSATAIKRLRIKLDGLTIDYKLPSNQSIGKTKGSPGFSFLDAVQILRIIRLIRRNEKEIDMMSAHRKLHKL